MPLISIITPVYNREDCIERCVESIATQQENPVEHVIVNDGSKDRTGEICETLAKKYPHIKYIDLGKNFGVNYAFNRGIEAASGEYINFLGSDDFFAPGSLKIVAEELQKHPQYKHFLFVADDLVEMFRNHHILRNENHIIRYEDWLKGTITGDFVHFISRDSFNENLFPEDFRIYESLNFLRIYRANKEQYFVNKVVTIRERDRADSVSREYQLDNKISMNNQYRYMQKLLEWFYDDYKSLGIFSIEQDIQKTVILGVALGKYLENGEMLKYLSDSPKTKILRLINSLHLQLPVYLAIKLKSSINTFRRRIA